MKSTLVSAFGLAVFSFAQQTSAACHTTGAADVTLVAEAKLPDPFEFEDGTEVTTKAEWECRRQEIKDLFQAFELGTKPGKPHRLGSRFYAATNTLALNATEGGNSIAWNVTIKYPNTTESGPYPLVIAYGGASIPIPSNVALINFNNGELAEQNSPASRGVGKFYQLYGKNATASALMAWAWGVSRIIDALEDTPRANIDPKRIAITGCSRNGKGALVAGAFDDRIALTIPQESGSGGSACWRISDAMFARGQVTQTASEIVGENVWFSTRFADFANNIPLLPVDHHELAGLVAPRGLFIPDNNGYLWLGPESSLGCMTAARDIYTALGVPNNIGYSLAADHLHCSYPTAAQGSQLNAFFQKFLFNEATANTNIFEVLAAGVTINEADWVDWPIPSLN